MKILVVLITVFSAVCGARILFFSYFPSISHQYVFGKIARELSIRGHEITFVTPNPMNDLSLKNLTEIDVSETYSIFNKHDLTNLDRNKHDVFSLFLFLHSIFEGILQIEFSVEGVRELMQKGNDSFDLILVEAHCPILYGLQHKFNAPLIIVSSLNCFSLDHNAFGNPTHPVLYPELLSDFGGPLSSIIDKLSSLFFTGVVRLTYKFFINPASDVIARQYFGNDMPYIEELMSKNAMLMLNVNPIFSDRRPNVPNVIEFFNIHMSKTDSINQDLQQILDNAKEGVVYFSLGTNVRFDHVQGDMKKDILEALGALPYTVICKWESDSVAGQPKNVHLRKWLPQQAILAHPNVKVFVTQGGLQSSEEAIINAVPLVVIPFLGDQPLNAKVLTSNGMAETITPKELSKDILIETILKVSNDEKYRNRAKDLRAIFLDQPQSGIDKVIWWCEYVIRHKGAKHLRSPAADIPLYEYFMLDVLAVVLIAFYISYKVLRVTLRILIRWCKKSVVRVPTKKQN